MKAACGQTKLCKGEKQELGAPHCLVMGVLTGREINGGESSNFRSCTSAKQSTLEFELVVKRVLTKILSRKSSSLKWSRFYPRLSS